MAPNVAGLSADLGDTYGSAAWALRTSTGARANFHGCGTYANTLRRAWVCSMKDGCATPHCSDLLQLSENRLAESTFGTVAHSQQVSRSLHANHDRPLVTV